MKPEIVDYLESRQPDIDVVGKWVCLGNPKTAQKSIMLGVLYDRQVRYRRGALNWQRVWDKIIVPQIDEVLIFTIIRNSWDKAVSAFHFLQQRGTIKAHWGFGDYIKQVLGRKGIDGSRHFASQYPSFAFNGRMIPGIFVGRFEQLHSDWETIAQRIDAPAKLPHRNASQHKPYTEYYDDESREIVGRLYAQEIEAIGYEFGK